MNIFVVMENFQNVISLINQSNLLFLIKCPTGIKYIFYTKKRGH